MAGAVALPRRPLDSGKSEPDLTSMRVERQDVVFLRKLAPYLEVNTAGEALTRLIDLCGRELLQRYQDAERKKRDH